MSLLDVVIILLIISWAGGLSLHVAGSFIHLLLVIALVVLIFRVLSGRRV
ncbi:MAG: lmo0937 family membrane protein [Elusimicrobiota bacterium]